jgi:hypothetical protein
MDVMGWVMGVVVGLTGLGGVAVLIVMAFGDRAAREGRGDERMSENLLVAPRGARYGDATRLVLEAAEREQEQHAEVVHLHERRARRITGHAA